jgi:octaheme c-type cytochrome (tetrathionate reductase family)
VDDKFDFAKAENVDCLVCHETTGAYKKSIGGQPAPGVNLLAAAKRVGLPTRRNCGYCHFAGGGGDAVKHGDLDGTMYFPNERIDAHMGKHNLACTDCHRTQHHAISGRSMSVSIDDRSGVACTDCHAQLAHKDDRLNGHTKSVACQSCHIPEMAVESPTKMTWDWSTAGEDRPDANPHEYLKIKGSFTYAKNVTPEYAWFDGTAQRYLLGDKIDPANVTRINYPNGSMSQPQAKLWPFKVHRGKQVYDVENKTLLVPKTYGEGGFWTEFNWDKALKLGAETTGLSYSGKYGFVATEMWWPLSHMVATKDKSLQCVDCHGQAGRMNWKALGYEGDPAFRGGRSAILVAKEGQR